MATPKVPHCDGASDSIHLQIRSQSAVGTVFGVSVCAEAVNVSRRLRADDGARRTYRGPHLIFGHLLFAQKLTKPNEQNR